MASTFWIEKTVLVAGAKGFLGIRRKGVGYQARCPVFLDTEKSLRSMARTQSLTTAGTAGNMWLFLHC
jgi:hypothetical protein